MDREIVIQFGAPSFDNKHSFFTDSNGLEMQHRVDNYQPTYPLSQSDISEDGVTINYYPIASAISMKDFNSAKVFTIINDHT